MDCERSRPGNTNLPRRRATRIRDLNRRRSRSTPQQPVRPSSNNLYSSLSASTGAMAAARRAGR